MIFSVKNNLLVCIYLYSRDIFFVLLNYGNLFKSSLYCRPDRLFLCNDSFLTFQIAPHFCKCCVTRFGYVIRKKNCVTITVWFISWYWWTCEMPGCLRRYTSHLYTRILRFVRHKIFSQWERCHWVIDCIFGLVGGHRPETNLCRFRWLKCISKLQFSSHGKPPIWVQVGHCCSWRWATCCLEKSRFLPALDYSKLTYVMGYSQFLLEFKLPVSKITHLIDIISFGNLDFVMR